MPESRKTRLAEPTRPRQPHVGESFDPVGLHRGGGGPGIGVFVMIGAGILGFAYAFNIAGLQGIVDSILSGFDSTAKSHTGDVVALAPKALPYVGYALLGAFVLIVLIILGRVAESIGNSLKRTKPARVAKVDPVKKVDPIAQADKPKEPEGPKPAQEFLRPRRLAVREEDLLPKPIQSAGNEPKID